MKDFYIKDEFTIEDIFSLIKNEVEESIYLDFKDAKALDKSDNKKKEISKDVASFANSDGGIIIYGITEENHKASKISYVDGNIYTKEWLEQIINSSIQRRIPNLLVFPIRNNNNLSETIYIVKIPKSFEAPHLSKEKRFYKRFNFESVQMEEYEIRQSYGQKLKSKLKINGWAFNFEKLDERNEEYIFSFEVQILNEGTITESDYKINVYFESYPYITLSWPASLKNYNCTELENRTKISGHSIFPIYPEEAIDAFKFNLKVAKEHIKYAFDNVPILIKLFYSGGEDEYETTLSEMAKKFLENYESTDLDNLNNYEIGS